MQVNKKEFVFTIENSLPRAVTVFLIKDLTNEAIIYFNSRTIY